jgi:hypothetical protein
MDAAALQNILRRTNPTITAEREALATGRWEAYLRKRVPPPSRLNVGRHRAWQAAFERALQIGQRARVREALVVPVWYGSNPDAVPDQVWMPAVAVGYDDDSNEVYEETTLGGVVLVARLEEAVLGFIMPSRFYAPEVDLPYRNAHYVAVESRRIERVIAIEKLVGARQLPQPDYEVAAFAVEAEPAVALDGLDAALAARVQRLVEQLRIVPASAN